MSDFFSGSGERESFATSRPLADQLESQVGEEAEGDARAAADHQRERNAHDDARLQEADAQALEGRPRSLLGDAWFDLRHQKVFWFSSVIIFIVMLIAIFPNLFADVAKTSSLTGGCNFDTNYLLPPGAGHWFGTDQLGCDVYTFTIFGARPSIAVGLIATILTTGVGAATGLIAGYYGGWLDSLLSRIMDIFLGLPLILGGIILLTAISFPSIWGIVLVLVVLGWAETARLVRATTIEVKNKDFVLASRALGASDSRIMRRHVLPNAMGPAIIVAVIGLAVYIGAEATFSFLGLGLQDPDFSWGTMISNAETVFFEAPWTLLFPAGFLVATILAFVLLGDAVSEALDPKRRT